MKKIYAFVACVAMVGATADLSAQNAKLQVPTESFVAPFSSQIEKSAKKTVKENAGLREAFWSEDFSNGFDGQDDNGAWTTSGTQGDYWFSTFAGEGGYSSAEPIGDGTTVYGNIVPNWFGARTPIESPTRENGFAMLDADRFNSTATNPENVGNPTTTANTMFAELISPIIDISDAPNGAELQYHTYIRFCCTAEAGATVTASVDGGQTWFEDAIDVVNDFTAVNTDYDGVVNVCLTQWILQADDLTQFRLKWTWQGSQSHYFWMVDDIEITAAPENDIEIGQTFLDRHEFTFFDPDATFTEYYESFEYEVVPDYLAKPLTIGAFVFNRCSQNTQTNVVVTATVTAPDGSTQIIETAPIDMPPVTEELIYADPVLLEALSGADPAGGYTVSFSVNQAEEDDRPENNIGGDRVFSISTDASDDFAVGQNGGLTYNGAFTQLWITQDALVNAPYVFPDPAITNSVITHVEVVFLNVADFAESQPGESVFFNLRQGSVAEENPDVPASLTSVFFGSDPYLYTDFELEYTIEADDLWSPTGDGFPQKWTSFELPNPVLIEPGVIYSPEMSIQAAAGDAGIVFVPISSVNQERYGLWWRNFSPNSQGTSNIWSTGAGFIAPSIRLRTSAALDVEKVTYEEGIKISQNWPNPFTTDSKFQYQLDKTGQVTFEIRDITGKLMHRENLGTVPAGVANTYYLDGNKLSSGIYTYSIITKDAVVTRKMVVE